MTEQDDRLIDDYLARVEQATTGLPPSQRIELLNDLREHIQALRTEQPGASEAHVRSILDRLGDPETIAAEAGASPSFTAPAASPPADALPRARPRLGVWVLVALTCMALLVLCGSAFLLAGTTRFADPVPVVTGP